jgi:hypothetical protein
LCHNELGDDGACLILKALSSTSTSTGATAGKGACPSGIFCDLSNNKIGSGTACGLVTEMLHGGGRNVKVCAVLESNQFDGHTDGPTAQALRNRGAFL